MSGRQGAWFMVVALTVFLGAALLATPQVSQPQTTVLLESARQKELVEGNLQEAIQIYQRTGSLNSIGAAPRFPVVGFFGSALRRRATCPAVNTMPRASTTKPIPMA